MVACMTSSYIRQVLPHAKEYEDDNLQIANVIEEDLPFESSTYSIKPPTSNLIRTLSNNWQCPEVTQKELLQRIESKRDANSNQLGHQVSLKWSTGAGPRIGCIADYPHNLKERALKFIHLSSKDLQSSPSPQSTSQVLKLRNPCKMMWK